MRRFAAGFTFVEFLAALLVVGIGMIGIAALYDDSVRADPASQPRLQAEELAQEMATRVSANAAGRSGYVSIIGVVCSPGSKQPIRPTDAAAQEAACWQDEVQKKLPNGSGSITNDTSSVPVTYVVAVSWSAAGVGASSYVMRVQPK
ncbi:MAG TPA: type IV pilus modification protein PilV [Steroidobacteraceae bacterium]|jgi:type IV pilus modification protein PilV